MFGGVKPEPSHGLAVLGMRAECCSWPPFVFVDLLTMLSNYAWVFMKLYEALADVENYVENAGDHYLNYEEDSQRVVSLIESHLNETEEHCRMLNLNFSIVIISRIRSNIDIRQGFGYLKEQFSRLRERIDDELRAQMFMHIPLDKVEYYQGNYQFGHTVSDNFPSMKYDISEAGKCFATGRNTACVFHLMRVMECGLRVLGKSLNDPNLDPKKNPSWESILRRCDKELQAQYSQRTPAWQRHQQFFAEATANLRAVKDAWRNPTLHVEQFYDVERALDIWNAVRTFMRHLATVLSG
jgi:hypothetical protein